MKLSLLFTALLLSSCSDSLYDGGEDMLEDVLAEEERKDEELANKARFITPWNGVDGMTVFARIDGNDHMIQDSVRTFTSIAPVDYEEKGIPEGAELAAIFLETIDSQLDYQGVFVLRSEYGPKIYRGFYVPGLGNYVEWEEVPLRFD